MPIVNKFVIQLFDQIWDKESIRAIGITTSQLENYLINELQQKLFKTEKKPSEVNFVIDLVNTNLNFKGIVTWKMHSETVKTKDAQSKYLEKDCALKNF